MCCYQNCSVEFLSNDIIFWHGTCVELIKTKGNGNCKLKQEKRRSNTAIFFVKGAQKGKDWSIIQQMAFTKKPKIDKNSQEIEGKIQVGSIREKWTQKSTKNNNWNFSQFRSIKIPI